MTVDQALHRGLLEKLRAAPLDENEQVRRVTCYSRSEGKEYEATLIYQTGEVRIHGPLVPVGEGMSDTGYVRVLPDDLTWE